MRILYISHDSVYPGEKRRFEQLARQPGISVSLLEPSNWREDTRGEQFESTDACFDVWSAPVLFPGYRHRSLFLSGIVRALRETQPDIIHLFEEASTLFAFQTVLLRNIFCKSAIVVFDNFQNILFDSIPYRFSQIYAICERYVFRYAAGATTRYSESAGYLRHRGFRGRIKIIPWGVDESLFRPVVSTVRDKCGLRGWVIGYFGRMTQEKGVFTLLEAASSLDVPYTLLLMGSGPDIPRIRRYAQARGISHQVCLTGYIPQIQLPEYYSAVDMVVVPSLTTPMWKEQFGRVIVEAMACGVPVIGSTSGAIPMVISKAGLLFREGDALHLAEQIQRLIHNPPLRCELVKRGQERVLREYTWKAFAARCREFYDELISSQ